MIVDVVDIDDSSEKYEIKFLNEIFLEEILFLQNIITENLKDQKSYYVEKIEFFRKHLANKNSVIGLFHKDQLVGFNIASFPGMNDGNLGKEVGIKKEELFQVVQFGPVAIHPAHRQRGLLNKIIEIHINWIRQIRYKHICLTIAPSNYPSMKPAMSHGFIIKRIKLKCDNLLRYILHLDLTNPVKYPQYSVRVPQNDIDSQKSMIHLGFYGYNAVKNDNGFDLVFGYYG